MQIIFLRILELKRKNISAKSGIVIKKKSLPYAEVTCESGPKKSQNEKHDKDKTYEFAKLNCREIIRFYRFAKLVPAKYEKLRDWANS